MFKVEIKRDGVITNYSEFKAYAECEAWVLDNHDYFPENYAAEIINVSAIKAFEAAKTKGLKNQKIGREVLGIIYAINDEKTKQGLLTQAFLTAMLQDPTLATVERLLLNGSLGSAKLLITNMPDTYFNSEHKDLILDYIEKNK